MITMNAEQDSDYLLLRLRSFQKKPSRPCMSKVGFVFDVWTLMSLSLAQRFMCEVFFYLHKLSRCSFCKRVIKKKRSRLKMSRVSRVYEVAYDWLWTKQFFGFGWKIERGQPFIDLLERRVRDNKRNIWLYI